jgi:predicted CXXCH cytochrome family protein
MKMAFIAVGAALTLAFIAGAWQVKDVSADNGPHKMGDGSAAQTDRCAGCHRAHTAKGRDYLFVQGAASLQEFCYTCHAGTGADTNVSGGQYMGGTGGLRGGGFDNSVIDHDNVTSDVGYNSGTPRLQADFNIPIGPSAAVQSRHNVEGTGLTSWGSGALGTAPVATTVSLNCASCHNPHGNGQYRILRPDPAAHLSPALTNRIGGTGVTVADAGCPTPGGAASGWPYNDAFSTTGSAPYNYTVAGPCTEIAKEGAAAGTGNVATYETVNYFQVDYVEPTQCPSVADADGDDIADNPLQFNCVDATDTPIATGLSAWCAQCHQRYLAPGGSRSRDTAAGTPGSGDADYVYRHTAGGTVSNASGTSSGGSTRQCISCHVAHGSPATSAATGYTADLLYPDGSGPAAAGTNNRLLKMDNRGVCLKCHGRDIK